jgi:hypothetical protein
MEEKTPQQGDMKDNCIEWNYWNYSQVILNFIRIQLKPFKRSTFITVWSSTGPGATDSDAAVLCTNTTDVKNVVYVQLFPDAFINKYLRIKRIY